VQAKADLAYADDLTTRVLGCMMTLVGKADAQRSWVTHAEGLAKLSSLVSTEVGSEGELLLKVGKSSIRITSEKIEIEAPAVTVKGEGGGLSASDDGLKLSSKKDAEVTVEKKLVLKSKDGASLSMQKEVKVDGTQILLNSPEQASDAPPAEPAPPTKIVLVDDGGNALPYQRFLVTTDDGGEVSGTTDKDGKAELELKMGGKVIFPDVNVSEGGPSNGMVPYIVRPGEYMAKLAHALGFDPDEVWKDPKNAELAKLRSPNVLHPGDIVYVPKSQKATRPVRAGATNKYVAKIPKVQVNVAFHGDAGPFAGEPYVIEGLGSPLEGTADADGRVLALVPVHVREIRVVFTKRNVAFPVRVGDMDPVSEPSGVRKRLRHLGYCGAAPGDEGAGRDARDRQALLAFQKARGLQPTGVADETTRQELVKVHGS
jgi:hypothetical protein